MLLKRILSGKSTASARKATNHQCIFTKEIDEIIAFFTGKHE